MTSGASAIALRVLSLFVAVATQYMYYFTWLTRKQWVQSAALSATYTNLQWKKNQFIYCYCKHSCNLCFECDSLVWYSAVLIFRWFFFLFFLHLCVWLTFYARCALHTSFLQFISWNVQIHTCFLLILNDQFAFVVQCICRFRFRFVFIHFCNFTSGVSIAKTDL